MPQGLQHARHVQSGATRRALPTQLALCATQARPQTLASALAPASALHVRWADTPQHRRWLVWIVMSASTRRLAVRQHVMPALLASIKILRAKATARCAWRARGPTWALLSVRARVLHARLVRTRMHRTWRHALHVVRDRSPTAAPALARRCAPNALRGSTQRHRVWRLARSVRQGSTSARWARVRRATAQCVLRARSRMSSLVKARRRVQRVRWADTPQHRRWLVWIVMSASTSRQQLSRPALLAAYAQ